MILIGFMHFPLGIAFDVLRAVLGENPHYSGKISFNPQVKVGYIPQEIRFAFDTDTILEAFRRECRSTDGEARSILVKYFFTGTSVFKRSSSLSGGEKVLLKLCILLQNEVNPYSRRADEPYRY